MYFINCFFSLDITINRNNKCSQSLIQLHKSPPTARAVSSKYSNCCCSLAGFFALIFLHHHTDLHITPCQLLYQNLYGFALLQFNILKSLCILAKKKYELICHNLSLVIISPNFICFHICFFHKMLSPCRQLKSS